MLQEAVTHIREGGVEAVNEGISNLDGDHGLAGLG
jgi:hypothetical protein